MDRVKEIKIPIKYVKDDKWLILSAISKSGNLRAVSITKPKQVPDWDGHHCNEVSVKTSIRYKPKKWTIN